jgi:hypothetical protein
VKAVHFSRKSREKVDIYSFYEPTLTSTLSCRIFPQLKDYKLSHRNRCCVRVLVAPHEHDIPFVDHSRYSKFVIADTNLSWSSNAYNRHCV